MDRPASSIRFQYLRTMAQQEKGRETWRVAANIAKHRDGRVTATALATGLSRTEALARSESENKKFATKPNALHL